jgi:hypothetical protein
MGKMPLIIPLAVAAGLTPEEVAAIVGLTALTAYFQSEAGQDLLKEIIDLFKRFPEPEGYPGERKGKEICELNKSRPMPVPPEKNPAPPPPDEFPKKTRREKLIESIADALDWLFGR